MRNSQHRFSAIEGSQVAPMVRQVTHSFATPPAAPRLQSWLQHSALAAQLAPIPAHWSARLAQTPPVHLPEQQYASRSQAKKSGVQAHLSLGPEESTWCWQHLLQD